MKLWSKKFFSDNFWKKCGFGTQGSIFEGGHYGIKLSVDPIEQLLTTGGAGYKDRQVVGYKDRQVAGYKVSLFFRPRKWLFIRSHLM